MSEIALAYKNKWIGKKSVFDNLTADCKALKPLFSKLYMLKNAKQTLANKLLLAVAQAGIKLTLADMDLLEKDKSNSKDAVSLIAKYTIWLKNTQSQ